MSCNPVSSKNDFRLLPLIKAWADDAADRMIKETDDERKSWTADRNPSPPPRRTTPAGALITWTPALVQQMNKHDAVNWQMASWSNGNPFQCTWKPRNVKFINGYMKLILDNVGCPRACDSKPFASGEYRTMKEAFGYGYYETRMKAAKGDGLVAGSFFTYRGVYGKPSHDEIDIEFLGKDTTRIQTNYYAEGKGNHEQVIPLGFDASQGFHNYGFRSAPDSITWYVDGKAVRTVKAPAREKLPSRPSKIMVNFWPGVGVDGWLNRFIYRSPLSVEYDWIKYSPLNKGPQLPAAVAPQIAPTVSAPSIGALNIAAVQKGDFSFNGGSLKQVNGIYRFSALKAKDPGFGVLTGNVDIGARKTVKFDIKGSLAKHGGYARFIAQVYRDTDNDYTPSVSLDPVALSNNFSTFSIDLNGINKVKKVQFLLVTDNGSCTVELKNIRFE